MLVCCIVIASKLTAQPVPGLDAIRVATGLTSPLFVTAPPGDFNRLFIVQQNGVIRILNLNTGLLNSTPFLTISGLQAGGEQGLLGLAFDPDYASNGKFYVKCTVPGGAFNNGTNQIRQYQVSSNPDIADTTPASVKIMLAIDQPQTNHNGGWIGFSPRAPDNHNLYIATGDGGAANDQDGGVGHIEPGGNAQNNTTLLGKMLRIHVDPTTGTYTIPPDNPNPTPSPSPAPTPRREIWLLGLRNPFRDSFDRATGRMLIGDVGQASREEIDVQQPANPGGGENYGWRDREGLIQNPAYPTPTAAPTPTPNPPRVDPIFDYPHSTGRTVIGGYVYRGAQFPHLQGVYVFGDYLGPSGGTARIFTLNYNGTTASNFQDITSQLFPIPTNSGNVSLVNLSSFGEDTAGELYMTDISNGNVYKISPMLIGAASRKIHGSTARDVDLPLNGGGGIECRTGGTSGNYTVVFKSALPLASVGNASISAGTAAISNRAINSANMREYLVNLTGVTNAQSVTVTLTNVTDVAGNSSSSVSATISVLVGDTNADKFVDAVDTSQTKSESGHTVTAANFREDVNVDNFIDAVDVSLVKANSGSALPSRPAPYPQRKVPPPK